MIIKVKQTLIEEGVVNHFKQNYGKYLAGTGALGLGALNLAGRGYLGVENQDYVQDKIVPIVHDLRAGALMDDNQSTINSYAKAAKIDNILGPESLSDTANKQSYGAPGTSSSTA